MAGASPNAFKTGALKSKIMNLAQTSVYQVKLQPPPNVLTFLRTKRGLDYTQRGENIELLCHQTTLPGTSFSTTEVNNDFSGVTERMVYRRMFYHLLNIRQQDFSFSMHHSVRLRSVIPNSNVLRMKGYTQQP